MNRIFLREYPKEKDISEHRNQLNIAVTGLGQSTGSTMIATALTFYFASSGKNSQMIQCLNPSGAGCPGEEKRHAETEIGGSTLLYDAAAFDRRFANREFHDVYEKIRDGQPVRGLKNMEKGVNFFLPTPKNRTEHLALDRGQRARLIQSAKGDVCIFDMESSGEWDEFLLDMDLIIVTCDPLPSKMIQSAERFKKLKRMELSGCRVLWAVNKMNAGVSKRQVKGYLKTNDILWIKHLPPEEIYGDEYACRFHWENEEIRCYLLDIFTKISQTWLGL